jgi:hypothetical protein
MATVPVPIRRPQPIRVFAKEPGAQIAIMPAAVPTVGFDLSVTLRGETAHFSVYFDSNMGQAGQQIADGVLASCENEYDTLSNVFGGVSVDHMNILISDTVRGGYHYGCSGTDLYVGAETSPVNIDFTRLIVVAEDTEVFSADQGRGWDCGASNGEALSRVMATLLYPAQLDGFRTSGAFLSTSNRPDYVNTNDGTDRNSVSTGCAVLFLYFMQHQLGYSWPQIVQAAGSPPVETYRRLTRSWNGFDQFRSDLDAYFPIGQPINLVGDDPYPVPMTAVKNILVDTSVRTPGAADFQGRIYIAWSGTDSNHRLNVMSSVDRVRWIDKITFDETSPAGASLCVFNNRLFLAWAGTDNQKLNVMSSADSRIWINKTILGETSGARPVLAVHRNQLVMGWVGTDSSHHLNIVLSADGINWHGKQVLQETSIDAPALEGFNNELVIAWTGTDSDHRLNVSSSPDLGAHWQSKVTLQDTSIAGPGLLVDGNLLRLSWSGTDSSHKINTFESADAVHFVNKKTLGDTSNFTPILTKAYGRLAVLWTGRDSSAHLNVMNI